ncbi:MAG: LCP family protein [Treponema sp.]|nr:LCP family protein [Treponema sp.]MEE3434206.1 LCP family protein [Treponema sp.]
MRLKRERKGMIFLVLIVAIFLALIVSFYVYLRADSVKDKLKTDPIIKALILIEDGQNVVFTDVFLAYAESGKGALITIPENTGAIYESLGRVDRIDAVFKEKGLGAYKREIERLLDLELSYTIEIQLADFERLADLLGGLGVFIPQPVDARGPNGEIWLLPSGAVRLFGSKVSSYMTYSLDTEEEDSVQERRQAMLVALLAALRKNRSVIFQRENFKRFASCFSSNLSQKDFAELLEIVTRIDYERVTQLEVTGLNQSVDGKVLLYPFRNGDFIKEVARRTVSSIIQASGAGGDRTYVLEIQNGTKVQGLARNTQILLQGAGFEVLNVSNAPSNDYEQTEIVDLIGNRDAAKSLGDFIRCTKITEARVAAEGENVETPNFDFILILGRDFDGRYVHGQLSAGQEQ